MSTYHYHTRGGGGYYPGRGGGARGYYRDDWIDDEDIPQSRHSVFIRGFPGDLPLPDIENFFAQELGPISFDFNRITPDRTKLFVAVRFESRELAAECMDRYKNSEILGHRVSLDWFRDRQRYRAMMQQYNSGPSRIQRGYSNSRGFNAVNRGMRYQRPYHRRSSSGGRHSRGRDSRSSSKSRSRSRTPRKRSRSHTPESTRRRPRTPSSDRSSEHSHRQKKKPRVEKHRRHRRTRSRSSTSEESRHSSLEPGETRESTRDAASVLQPAPARSDITEPNEIKVVPNEIAESIILFDEQDNNISITKTVRKKADNGISVHVEKSAATPPQPRQSTERVALSPAPPPPPPPPPLPPILTHSTSPSPSSKSLTHAPFTLDDHDAYPLTMQLLAGLHDQQKDLLSSLKPILPKETKASGVRLLRKMGDKVEKKREETLASLSLDQRQVVFAKARLLEQQYIDDCETHSYVVSTLLGKDPTLETKLRFALKEVLDDIHKKFIEEIDTFVQSQFRIAV